MALKGKHSETKAQQTSRLKGGGLSGALGLKADGFEELRAKLAALPDKVFRRVVAQASRKSMKIVISEARSNARAIKETGALAKSLGVKQKTYRRSGVQITIVGPRKGFKTSVATKNEVTGKMVIVNRDPQWYAHLVEFGTAPHDLGDGSNGRKGISTGGQRHPGAKAKPFLRPAMDNNRAQVLSIYAKAMGEGIAKQAKKKT